MRWRLRSALVAVLVTGIAAVLFIRRVEGSFLIDVGSRVLDPVGMARDAVNEMTRDCRGVVTLKQGSPEWNELQARLDQLGSPMKSSPIQILILNHWLLTESTFENMEPAIVLLEPSAEGPSVAAVWGGAAAPYRNGPAIRDYLRQKAPAAPDALLRCFDSDLFQN